MAARRDLPEDNPIDAIIQDAPSAQPAEDGYPYAPRSQPMRVSDPPAYENQVIRIAFLRFQSPTPAQYMVPKRFGMSAILGIMTALAVLFGGFRLLNAPPPVYLFFGLQTLVICFAQMLNSKTPRLASSIAGALLMPLFLIPWVASESRHFRFGGLTPIFAFLFIFGIPIGAFLGYLTGTCAAGIFLIMDYLEPYLQWQSRSSRTTNA
jgi:hypothetical protein